MNPTSPEVQKTVDNLLEEVKRAMRMILRETKEEFMLREPTDDQIHIYNEFAGMFSQKMFNLKIVVDPLGGNPNATTNTTGSGSQAGNAAS